MTNKIRLKDSFRCAPKTVDRRRKGHPRKKPARVGEVNSFGVLICDPRTIGRPQGILPLGDDEAGELARTAEAMLKAGRWGDLRQLVRPWFVAAMRAPEIIAKYDAMPCHDRPAGDAQITAGKLAMIARAGKWIQILAMWPYELAREADADAVGDIKLRCIRSIVFDADVADAVARRGGASKVSQILKWSDEAIIRAAGEYGLRIIDEALAAHGLARDVVASESTEDRRRRLRAERIQRAHAKRTAERQAASA